MKKAQPRVILLTRIKQWYLPVDAESYMTLRSVGIPLVRIATDFMPTLQLITRSNNIRGREISFTHEILNPFLSKVGEQWLKGEARKCTIHAKTMMFETTHMSGLEKAREARPKLQDCLERFFTRWGYKSTITLSEHRGKLRLHVEYWYDAKCLPVVALEKDAAEVPESVLTLGFTQIKMKLMPKEIALTVLVSQGGNFVPIHTSRCLYSQASDVRRFIAALMGIPNVEPSNFDNRD